MPLIVDDEAGLVEALTTALQRHYEALTAYSSKAAFETLARHPVDRVILDHRLPDMEGVAPLRFPMIPRPGPPSASRRLSWYPRVQGLGQPASRNRQSAIVLVDVTPEFC